MCQHIWLITSFQYVAHKILAIAKLKTRFSCKELPLTWIAGCEKKSVSVSYETPKDKIKAITKNAMPSLTPTIITTRIKTTTINFRRKKEKYSEYTAFVWHVSHFFISVWIKLVRSHVLKEESPEIIRILNYTFY